MYGYRTIYYPSCSFSWYTPLVIPVEPPTTQKKELTMDEETSTAQPVEQREYG